MSRKGRGSYKDEEKQQAGTGGGSGAKEVYDLVLLGWKEQLRRREQVKQKGLERKGLQSPGRQEHEVEPRQTGLLWLGKMLFAPYRKGGRERQLGTLPGLWKEAFLRKT